MKIFLILLIIIAAGVAGFYIYENWPRNQVALKPGLITVAVPRIGEMVKSPLTITGKARGYWFFEASFPIRIYDDAGQELGVAVAQAQDEWMTTEFVSFKAVLEFKSPATETGVLVLEKDNPSGLAENADELRVPIKFDSSIINFETIQVKAYFGNNVLNPGAIDCSKVFSITRNVPKMQAVARAALEELLKGTTKAEEREGYFSSINDGVKIQSLRIDNGIAYVDFDKQLEFRVGGSCRVASIANQIRQTLLQFPTVREVIISIDGRTADILQP